ncbi:MAG: phosphoribosylamine--glycine ligase, partial [Pseudomonadota bacterium]|nr:phosphoribosylamine--glycine ligase [Pseudomonadota bacterium]
TGEGPKLIEYNVRFGDPECQVLMMRLESDLLDLMTAVARSRLAELPPPSFADATALTVVMAADGYPEAPAKGGSISGLEAAGDAKIFQAGTSLVGEKLVSSGGRVLTVTALGTTILEARERAYSVVEAIDFPSGFYRRDIGWREIARQAASAGQAEAIG